MFFARIIAEIASPTRAGAGEAVRYLGLLIVLAVASPLARAHEVPSDVTVRMLVRPEGQRLKLLVRAPLEAMQDITFPLVGPGYLDVPNADSQLRDAARLWLADSLEVYEDGRRVSRLEVAAVRASIPSDRSFEEYESALAHLRGPPLPAGLDPAELAVWVVVGNVLLNLDEFLTRE